MYVINIICIMKYDIYFGYRVYLLYEYYKYNM